MQDEVFIEVRDDAGGGHYRREGWCRREGTIEGRGDVERRTL